MNNNQPVLLANDVTIKKMAEYYMYRKRPNVNPDIYFIVDVDGAVITAYTSGKVVFQGKRADIYFATWNDINNNLQSSSNNFIVNEY